jgi:hypothetical protein
MTRCHYRWTSTSHKQHECPILMSPGLAPLCPQPTVQHDPMNAQITGCLRRMPTTGFHLPPDFFERRGDATRSRGCCTATGSSVKSVGERVGLSASIAARRITFCNSRTSQARSAAPKASLPERRGGDGEIPGGQESGAQAMGYLPAVPVMGARSR